MSTKSPLWSLFAANKIDELRKMIAALQKENAGWKPSGDLTQKIRRKETRARISSLMQDGRWQDLVDYTKAEGVSGADLDVDVQWMVAEALARTKQTNEAIALFKTILGSKYGPSDCDRDHSKGNGRAEDGRS